MNIEKLEISKCHISDILEIEIMRFRDVKMDILRLGKSKYGHFEISQKMDSYWTNWPNMAKIDPKKGPK